jgi:hypothetical protein
MEKWKEKMKRTSTSAAVLSGFLRCVLRSD